MLASSHARILILVNSHLGLSTRADVHKRPSIPNLLNSKFPPPVNHGRLLPESHESRMQLFIWLCGPHLNWAACAVYLRQAFKVRQTITGIPLRWQPEGWLCVTRCG